MVCTRKNSVAVCGYVCMCVQVYMHGCVQAEARGQPQMLFLRHYQLDLIFLDRSAPTPTPAGLKLTE